MKMNGSDDGGKRVLGRTMLGVELRQMSDGVAKTALPISSVPQIVVPPAKAAQTVYRKL